MSKKLIAVVKELSAGMDTVVDYLTEIGFSIEKKPSSVVTDEMYKALLVKFQKSVETKNQADKLGQTTRSGAASPPPGPAPAPVVKEKAKPAPVEVKEIKREVQEIKVKVVGKIELEKPKPEPKAKTETSKKKETVAPAPTPEPEVVAPPPKPSAPEEDMMRHEAPKLKGLKVQGKIELVKEKPKQDTSRGGGNQKGKKQLVASSSEGTDAKKKRKRKKLPGEEGSDINRGGGPRRSESGEITQSQIDAKIKATMARLGGGKSKRQKIRRDKRDVMREKEEMRESQSSNQKLLVTEFVTASELAGLLDVPPTQIIMTCMNLGVIVSINQRLDAEVIELVANEFGREIEFITVESQTDFEEDTPDDPEDLQPRAPVVTIMGHVDHGKTSLLDFIRKTNIVAGEAGGITQHIGAYEVIYGEKKQRITFLDTPGHEAFTAMRARGAKVTDIAVIVISADDSIMPQTREAISHAQAAQVPLVFAINKIDKPGANPEKIKEQLSQMNLLVEEWGGKYQSQDISAKQGLNVDKLLEKILLEAELLNLTANPDKPATGTILEASLDKGRGYTAKVLVQNGSLHVGDAMVSGEFAGKVKAMFNERGKRIEEAGPSSPVLVLGLPGAPTAGEVFKVFEDEAVGRQFAAKRAQISREQSNRASKRISLDEIGRRLALGTFKELNLIVKGDVDGSVEALTDALLKQSVETVKVNVIHKAVGQIVESDVLLASASDAIIIGFQVRPSLGARKLAEKEGVEIKLYSIIYEAIDEINAAIEGLLEPTIKEEIIGQVEVREIYKISKVGTVAGCHVVEGRIARNSHIRLIRDGIVIYPVKEGQHGELSSLKRFKDDAKEVKSGHDCGLTIKNYNDIKVGDFVEAYEVREEKATLN